MAPGVSFSTTSFDCPPEDGWSDPDDRSSASDDDHIHIGLSSRPPVSFVLPNNPVSKSLPSRLAGGIVSLSREPRPPRSQSAHLRTAYYDQRAPGYPPPPPTLPTSTYPSQPIHEPNRWRIDAAEPQNKDKYGHHDYDGDSFFSSSRGGHELEIEATGEPDHVRRLRECYAGLENQRSVLLDSFSEAQSQRARVRRLRQSKDEADQKFMAAARTLLSDSVQLRQLHQLFKAMQSTRRNYHAAEQRFDKIVDELQHGQKELKAQEKTLYEAALEVLGTAIFSIGDHEDNHSDKSENSYLRGISGDRPETIHPLYEKLRAAFGELQLAKELLINTQMKRKALHARKIQPLTEDSLDLLETYGDAGKKKALELRAMALMTDDDIEQLQEYDALEQHAKQDIEIYTRNVKILQQECRESGVLPASSYFQQEILELDSSNRDEIRLVPGPFDNNEESATLAHPVFPLLLSNPTHLLRGFPQTSMQSLKSALQLPLNSPVRAKQIKEAAREANMDSLLSTAESEDKSEYVNRWLLHKLHNSAMEAELLWTTFRSRLKILDIDRWQRDVLQFWWRDEPVDFAPAGVGDNGTNKASELGPHAESNTVFSSYSESGQLDRLQYWKLDDYWL
ncbi:hypothetical protein NUW58_g6489 [Xylaria curta]|uniref:Uncharacterized protein n=1 Tax=Xylaria curta TaxID=42375 RepID=A0ACC1NUZ3_9PEZI|nr:hypothetical protein NUW58_g6489 [Xylaria curta]